MGFPWTPDLAVGVPEIDQQHQELFLRVERLLHSIAVGDRDEVGRLLRFLGDYAVKHFGVEERWMARSEYPGLEAHKSEHDRFMQEYLRMQVEYEEKGPTVLMGMRVNNWIGEWLRRHIAESDLQLGRWLRSRMTRGPGVP